MDMKINLYTQRNATQFMFGIDSRTPNEMNEMNSTCIPHSMGVLGVAQRHIARVDGISTL